VVAMMMMMMLINDNSGVDYNYGNDSMIG